MVRRLPWSFVHMLVLASALTPPAWAAERPLPPQQAVHLLEEAIVTYGDKRTLDADYGHVNRLLLDRLADAIDLVEAGAGPDAPVALKGVLGRWREDNRGFIASISADSARLPSPDGDPLRYRLAQQQLYQRILHGLRLNLNRFQQMVAAWPTAGKHS